MDTQTQTETRPGRDERQMILHALERWIAQRGGLEFGNYGDPKTFRQEQRRITRQRDDALTLLRAVAWRTSIGAPELRVAFHNAYSGRLSIVDRADGAIGLSYCTGQYFPTEYRAAAAAVLASALWTYTRESAMPSPVTDKNGRETYNGKSAGDWIRSYFRKEFGARMQRSWFD